MAIRNDKFSKFRGYISILSGSIKPDEIEQNKDFIFYQNSLNAEQLSAFSLGSDFLMAKEFTEGGLYVSGKDLSKVSGALNYAQALTHRLITYRGTMPGDATFGVPWQNYLGKTYGNKSLIIADLSQDIENEVFKDRRTAELRNIEVNFVTPNVVTVDLTVVPIYTNFPDIVELTITSGE
jgi:hypothetical protein